MKEASASSCSCCGCCCCGREPAPLFREITWLGCPGKPLGWFVYALISDAPPWTNPDRSHLISSTPQAAVSTFRAANVKGLAPQKNRRNSDTTFGENHAPVTYGN